MKQGIVEPYRCEACDYCKETKVLTKVIKSGDVLSNE